MSPSLSDTGKDIVGAFSEKVDKPTSTCSHCGGVIGFAGCGHCGAGSGEIPNWLDMIAGAREFVMDEETSKLRLPELVKKVKNNISGPEDKIFVMFKDVPCVITEQVSLEEAISTRAKIVKAQSRAELGGKWEDVVGEFQNLLKDMEGMSASKRIAAGHKYHASLGQHMGSEAESRQFFRNPSFSLFETLTEIYPEKTGEADRFMDCLREIRMYVPDANVESVKKEAGKLGREFIKAIEGIVPAQLINPDKIVTKKKNKERPPMNDVVWSYVDYAFKNGKEGKRFAADYWQNSPGWAVNVPEIIEFDGVTHVACRWWNWIGGFSSRGTITKAVVVDSSGQDREGYVLYKRGLGYQPNSQYFVDQDGGLFQYQKQVIGHDPVRYLPTGGRNVGFTETIISDELATIEEDNLEDAREMLNLIKDSKKEHIRAGLREVMKTYFKLG